MTAAIDTLQMAQMLADLNDLNAAQEARAAEALVNANKTVPTTPTAEQADPMKTAADHLAVPTPENRHHQRTGSASSILSRTVSPAKFDKLGRRIIAPPLTRTTSAHGTTRGSPSARTRTDNEDDVDRATSLMQLYEIRSKIRQQDNSGLNKAREKINALMAKQQQQVDKKEANPDVRVSRYTYPKNLT